MENLLLDILNYFEDFSLRVYKVKKLLVRIIRKRRIKKREVKQMVRNRRRFIIMPQEREKKMREDKSRPYNSSRLNEEEIILSRGAKHI